MCYVCSMCNRCGKVDRLRELNGTCPVCGAQRAVDDDVCPSCGHRRPKAPAAGVSHDRASSSVSRAKPPRERAKQTTIGSRGNPAIRLK